MIIVYILILLYSLSRYYDLSCCGLASDYALWQIISYNFVHLGFMHLLCNVVGFLLYRPIIRLYYGRILPAVVITLSVVLSSMLFCSERPTFGASTIIFAMTGMYLNKIWQTKHPHRKKYTLMLFTLLAIQTAFGYNVVNWQIHISALVSSFLITRLCTITIPILRLQKS